MTHALKIKHLPRIMAGLAILTLSVAGCSQHGQSVKPSPVIERIAGSGGQSYDIAIRREATKNNSVELLMDGPETYDAMFDALVVAEDHINLETFILADDVIGYRLADILKERSSAGVVVNLMYDAFGSGMTDDSYFDDLEDSGINVVEVRPIDETVPWDLVNRDHRKILIVDGKTGFTGGLNFTRKYRFDSENPPEDDRFGKAWRDTHVRIQGPAVKEMQRAFLRNWAEHADEAQIVDANYFPEIEPAGNQEVYIAVAEGDSDDISRIFEHYVAAIRDAERRVWITQAYFVPNDELLTALHDAAGRGVDVRLVLPRRTDNGLTVPASRSYYSDLLESGVRIFEYNTSHLHAKTALTDDGWATVGSSNLDTLSLAYNDELNAIVLDREFNEQLARAFLDDMSESQEITPEAWADRGLWMRVKEFVGRSLKPVL